MFLKYTFLLVCLISLAGPGPENALAQSRMPFLDDDVRYLWPTNASNYMSSTFGETRRAHFHAAMDIGTWGRPGYRVVAARNGVLYRAAVGPRGYGNVVYLKHSDGSYSLYAHLKDFAPEIRSIVDSIRLSNNYSFTLDEILEEHEVHFRQGDLIGISGSTGVGPPHLHFELRTPSDSPFNPLLTNITVDDHIPPTFVSLAVEPIGSDALVNGRKAIYRRSGVRRGNAFDFGTIVVFGKTGLAVRVFDRADGSNNVHAVYDLRLKINDELYFHSRLDSFSFDHTRQMFIDRVYPLLRSTGKTYQRLYIKNGNELPFYSDTGRNGVIDLPPGDHRFEVSASDFYGNTSKATGVLRVRSEKPFTAAKNRRIHIPFRVPDHHALTPISDAYTYSGWLSPSGSGADREWIIETLTPGSFSKSGSLLNINQPGQVIDLQGYHSTILTLDNISHFFHRLLPQKPAAIYSQDQRVWADFGPESLFDTLSVAIDYQIMDNGLPSIRLYPESEPLNKPATLNFVLDSGQALQTNLAFYYAHPRYSDRYRYVKTRRNGSVISAKARHLGTYYILEDNLAPEISDPRIRRRSDGKWELSVGVRDDLSGIDYQSAEFHWNGIRGIAEYDPEKHRLLYHHPEFSPQAVNRLLVRVSDRTGNTAEKQFELSF